MSRYDRRGRPITRERWESLFDDEDYCLLARTVIGTPGQLDLYRVSTAWSGLNVQVGPGPPLIFLTLATGKGGDRRFLYSTEEQARAGHEGIVHDLVAEITEEYGMAETVQHPYTDIKQERT